jgi:hypothetical protein
MVTNTPVGVLALIVILPSCLDFAIVHRLLRQTSTLRNHGRNELCDRQSGRDDGLFEGNPIGTTRSVRLVPNEMSAGRNDHPTRP